MRFEIEVTETVAHYKRYVVEAATAPEAERKAAIGDTIEEQHLGDGGVLDRILTSKPARLPEQASGKAYFVAMDVSVRLDPEVTRAYLLGAKGSETGQKLLEESPAPLAGMALTHAAPNLEDVGLADLKIVPHPPDYSAFPTFRLAVTVTDPDLLEREARAMYEAAFGGLDPEDVSDLPQLVYEVLIGSNAGPAPLDFGIEYHERRTHLCVELACNNCSSPLVVDGRWPDGSPTYVDQTGGDVCAALGRNDRHAVGMGALIGLVATQIPER